MAREPDQILELGTRRRIYAYLQDHPGAHLRLLERELNMSSSNVEYHLHLMEKAGLVTARRETNQSAYFVQGGLDRRDKDVLVHVRRRLPRRLLTLILARPGTTAALMAQELGVAKPTVTVPLHRLIAAGLVRVDVDGRSKRLSIIEPERLAKILVTYRATFMDELVDRFAAAFEPLAAPAAPAPASTEPSKP